jgi:TonB family protein
MFEQLEQRKSEYWGSHGRLGSFLVHAAILAGVVFHFAPTAVKLSSIRHGSGGTGNVTQIATESDEIAFPVIAKAEKSPFSDLRLRAEKEKKASKKSENRAEETTVRAGASYGSMFDGPLTGSEVRPALPYIFPDPPVTNDDLPDGVNGKVIVEITIDELGNVIDTKLLQGLHPEIDRKVIATLKQWRFRPATRDGRAIASKQDALFTYPS